MIRCFFDDKDFLEVHTPVLTKCPGAEVHLQYFETHWLDSKKTKHTQWLRSSPEIALKAKLIEGLTKIYEIGPCFRNHGELGLWHRPEFMMLEYYQAGISFSDFKKLTLDLINQCWNHFQKTPLVWHQLTVKEAIKDF
jgi:elongation factor P--beta-lysine ligase